ncbi:MAG: glycosyltransferase family 39 protein [Anaerolineae bacterium]|nr:glycosyltransferase family 39 protein [Anaerolineae bacterium]
MKHRPVAGEGRVAPSEWLKTCLPALGVALTAFAFRMHGLEHVRQNYDRAYPHGLGLFIREAIATGRLDQLPAVSLLASINLPNPAGASYFYALLTALEPGAYVATALNAMLGALAAVIAYDLARRLWGRWAALAAGLLASVSLWAAWVARGAWLQGPLEAMSALTLWLAVNGLTRDKPRFLFAAFAWAAACLHTYLVAAGLLGQLAAATLIGVLGLRRSRSRQAALGRAAIAGAAVCLLSALIYVGAVVSARASLEAVINNPHAFNEETRAGALNLDPLNHALRIASGRDFENTFVEADTPWFDMRDRWSDARATIVDALVWVGLGMLLIRALGRPHRAQTLLSRLMLGWFTLPILATFFVANAVMRDWKVHVFYLLLASPAPYVLAGAPFALLAWVAHHVLRWARYAILAVASLAAAFAVAIPWWNADGETQAAVRFPYHHDGFYSLPVVWQMRLAEQWRALGCATLHAQEDARWVASLLGEARPVRAGEIHIKGASSIWQVRPEGGDCALLMAESPAPAHAEAFAVTIPGQKRTDRTPVVLTLYRSLPIESALRPEGALDVNLGEGWQLLALQTPAAARPGEMISVMHDWRVGLPPAEPHWWWYFAPFVKLFAADGRMIVQVDDAPAILGHRWRPGHVQASAVRFALPSDLPPGEYALEMSLFDPNQKKNAVYFDPRQPGAPIVTIRRALSVR